MENERSSPSLRLLLTPPLLTACRQPPPSRLPARWVAGAAQLVLESKRSPEGLALLTSLRTLDEPTAKKLFTQAVEQARAKILAVGAKIEAAASRT